MNSTRRYRFVLILAATAALGLTSGILYSRVEEPADNAFADATVQARAPEAKIIQTFEDDSVTFALHWRQDDELWYVSSAADGQLTLWRYTVSTESLSSWPLPQRATQTMYTFLAEDGQGLLWIAANYSVAAFDPKAEEFVFAETLDTRPAELDAAAMVKPNFDGSWVTGLGVDGEGRAIVARHNTNALYDARSTGLALAESLDAPPTGLRVIAGRVEAIARGNDEVAVIKDGRTEPLHSLGDSGCGLKEQAPGQGALLTAAGKAYPRGLLLAPDDPLAIDAASGRVALGLAFEGAVVVADCRGGTVAIVQIGSDVVYPDGLIDDPRTSQPLESLRFAYGVAISPTGQVAIADSAHNILVAK